MTKDKDIIHIEPEDLLLAEPQKIEITEADLQAATPMQNIAGKVEDLGSIELPDVPCAICHNMIEIGQSFGRCKVCNTPYHKECWDFNGGCAVLGCAGSKNRNAFQPAKTLD